MILSGERTTATAATTVLAIGITVVLVGVLTSDPARAAGGACLTITALTLIALRLIRTWITDTAAERSRIQDAIRAADIERMRYLAAQSALGVERDRMRRDAEEATRHSSKQIKAEHARLREQFEEERAALISETFEAAFSMLTTGRLMDSLAHTHGRAIIPFPIEPARTHGRDISRP
ncbi:hypothetical protein [Streptomyces sp. NPDC051173]|uniref:hypothetical protein n=1 Tax=Streptomyces sp. NPDC051173 TaxID=3155164 RepID=UPI00344CE275